VLQPTPSPESDGVMNEYLEAICTKEKVLENASEDMVHARGISEETFYTVAVSAFFKLAVLLVREILIISAKLTIHWGL
jgi:hypothetical protein